MDWIELIKAVVALISAVAGIAIYKLNHAKMSKTRGELVEQFQNALDAEKKYSVIEIFRLLHGVRMTYEDIKALCSDSDASHIIFALQKTPGMVKYESSRFQYSDIFKKKWFRKTNKWFSISAAWFFGMVTAGLVVGFIFSESKSTLAILFLLIPCFAFLTYQIREIRYDSLIERLAERET